MKTYLVHSLNNVTLCLFATILFGCGGGNSGNANNTNPEPPVVSLSLGASDLVAGKSTSITWTATRATSCAASGAWNGTKDLSGNESISAANAGTYAYTLSCTGPAGTSTQTVKLQVTAANLVQPVAFIAGQVGGVGYVDGKGTEARIYGPAGITLDSKGNTFFADTSNHTIRKVSVDGVVTTYAGISRKPGFVDGPAATAQFDNPTAIAVDRSGNVYVGDSGNRVLRKISVDGMVSTITAQTWDILGLNSLAIDSHNNLYFTDSERHAVWRLNSNGNLESLDLLNRLLSIYIRDCTLQSPCRGVPSSPFGAYVDENDVLFVADERNASIVYMTADGTVGTLQTGGAPFTHPYAITGDMHGNLYVTDPLQNEVLKLSTSTQNKTPMAFATSWKSAKNGSTDINTFSYSYGIAAFQDQFVLVGLMDSIQKISADGKTSTFVGTPLSLGKQDGVGGAASFKGLSAIVADGNGFLFACDTENHTIRKINISNGEVTTFAGQAGVAGSTDGVGNAARLTSPSSIAIDSAGNLYVPDTTNRTIRKITPSAQVSTFAGTVGESGSTDGIGAQARFVSPTSITINKNGDLFVGEFGVIRKISANGEVSTFSKDILETRTLQNSIGSVDQITVDSKGNVYIYDRSWNVIRKVSPSGSVSAVAGNFDSTDKVLYRDGNGSNARFAYIRGLAVDANDNLLVSDYGSNTIRKVNANADVTTIAGTFGYATVTPSSTSMLSAPQGLAFDRTGRLFIVLDQAIFQLTLSGK